MLDTISTGPWPTGMDNRAPDHALQKDAVRNAVNVDISNGGNAKRRDGYAKVISGLAMRGGYSGPAGVFYVMGNTLYRWNDDDSKTAIYIGVSGPYCSYDTVDDKVYFTDGTKVLRIDGNVVTTLDIPAGRIIRQHNGRLYVADGKTIWYTLPFSETVDFDNGFLQYEHDVTIMESVVGGLWVVADKTYFLAGGDPQEFVQREALEYGAVYGTSVKLKQGGVCWFSTKGAVIAGDGGEIRNIQEKHVAPDVATTGAGLLREKDGLVSFIASLRDAVPSGMAAKSFMNMEVVRRGG